MPKKTLGETIRSRRLQNGWTAKEFIKKLDEDLSPSYIAKIELHDEIPSPELLNKMAHVLGLSVERLVRLVKIDKIRRFKMSLDKKYTV